MARNTYATQQRLQIEQKWLGKKVKITSGFYFHLGYRYGVVKSVFGDFTPNSRLFPEFWVKFNDNKTGRVSIKQMEFDND